MSTLIRRSLITITATSIWLGFIAYVAPQAFSAHWPSIAITSLIITALISTRI